MAFVDKRETALKSPNMEPLGLRRALKDLSDSGNVISEVVTDAHTQVPPILSTVFVLFNAQVLLNAHPLSPEAAFQTEPVHTAREGMLIPLLQLTGLCKRRLFCGQ